MQGALGIHVLGRGFGETIVLEFPNGSVGLIDCCSPQLAIPGGASPSTHNPVLRFLADTLRAESLAFVGLTHPHEDHARGLSHVLSEYAGRIGQIWMFRAFQSDALTRLLRAMRLSSRRLPVEELLNERPGTFAFELVKVRDQVRQHCHTNKSDPDCFRDFSANDSFYLPNEPVSCTFLGPSDVLSMLYEAHLIDSLANAIDASGLGVDPQWNPGSINHNLVSASLLLTYGRTKILLGGDMELDAWDHVMKRQAAPPDSGPSVGCQLFKVSHHGSVTGIHPQLVEQLPVDGRPPMAILTPFNRHRHPLPTAAGLAQLLPHVSELFVTNVNEVRRALKKSNGEGKTSTVHDTGEVVAQAVPFSWSTAIRAHPELLGALNQNVTQVEAPVAVPTSVPSIPLAWYSDIQANPKLWSLLSPVLQQEFSAKVPTPAMETDCRVSFYFNASGEELREHRYVGSAAGTMALPLETTG
ncbi:MAG TPA: hypothetical protein DDY91_16570 [Planctomycetaceae bacterium]|nr:hypothetical protein [Planctomycetaceae bacterium]